MQTLAHPRGDSAVELLFFKHKAAGAIGELLPIGHALAVAGTSDCNQDASDRAWEAGVVKHRAHLLLSKLRVAQPAGMKIVEVDDDVMVRWHFRDHWKHR